MKVLVTGATGFLGRHICAALAQSPDLVPVAMARRPERLGGAPIELRAADVTDPRAVERALAGIEVVVHAAGDVSHRPEDAERMYAAHVTGTRVLVAAAEAAGVRRLVHLSSSGTVAVSARPVTADEAAPSPLAVTLHWPYYRAKLFAEQVVLASRLDVVVLNPSLLLGPPAPAPFHEGAEAGAQCEALRLLLRQELPVAPRGGVSFVDVRDVAQATVTALRLGHPGRRHLLASANWTFAEFYARAARVAEVAPPGVTAPRFARELLRLLPARVTSQLPAAPIELEMASHWWWADSSRAAAELGFSPRDPGDTLREAVRSSLSFASRPD